MFNLLNFIWLFIEGRQTEREQELWFWVTELFYSILFVIQIINEFIYDNL